MIPLYLKTKEFLIFYVLFFSFLYNSALAQVNTETLRKVEMQNGWYGMLSSSLGYQSGNSEYLQFKSGVRVDFLHNKYYSFLVFNYNRGSQAKKLFLNNAFVHLRGTYVFNKNLILEVFGQTEFDDFIKLKDRKLLGSGLRIRLFKTDKFPNDKSSLRFFLGLGGMWEKEELDDQETIITEIFRTTNYISFYWKIDERVTFNVINYYQRSLNDFADYRVLLESNLGFYLTKSIIFTASIEYRYDSLPPSGVKNYDFELNNGISVTL